MEDQKPTIADVLARFDALDGRLDVLDGRLDRIEAGQADLQATVDRIETTVKGQAAGRVTTDMRVSALERRVDALEAV